MKPHIFSQMVNEVRDIAKQYGHTEQFRCRVADLLKGYIPVEHGKGIHGAQTATENVSSLQAQLSQAERVVVPECGYRFNTHCMCAIPSSRVLNDGEVAVGEAELAALREFANGWSEFRSQFDDIQYHYSGMGCGIEDRGIHDRYAACEHGWECAMERVAERFPEIDTLDALRAQGNEGAT